MNCSYCGKSCCMYGSKFDALRAYTANTFEEQQAYLDHFRFTDTQLQHKLDLLENNLIHLPLVPDVSPSFIPTWEQLRETLANKPPKYPSQWSNMDPTSDSFNVPSKDHTHDSNVVEAPIDNQEHEQMNSPTVTLDTKLVDIKGAIQGQQLYGLLDRYCGYKELLTFNMVKAMDEAGETVTVRALIDFINSPYRSELFNLGYRSRVDILASQIINHCVRKGPLERLFKLLGGVSGPQGPSGPINEIGGTRMEDEVNELKRLRKSIIAEMDSWYEHTLPTTLSEEMDDYNRIELLKDQYRVIRKFIKRELKDIITPNDLVEGIMFDKAGLNSFGIIGKDVDNPGEYFRPFTVSFKSGNFVVATHYE